MEHRSLTRLPDYEWDRETERRWQRSLLPMTILCVVALASAVVCFILDLTTWAAVSSAAFVMSAILVIRAPFKSAPVSLRSGKRMVRFRNSDNLKKEFEILFVDEESKTYVTHSVFFKGDPDFRS
jgi:hypothetical protein